MIHGTVVRGTTPMHSFELPYPKTTIKDIRIIYGQSGRQLFVKTINDCIFEDNSVLVSLSQEDTFLFVSNKRVNIEIKLIMTDGTIIGTEEPIVLKVINSMSDEVID